MRYAKALYLKAEEKDKVQEVLSDIRLIDQSFSDYPELDQVIHHPAIIISKKKKILRDLFKDRVQPLTQLFLDLIVRNRREYYIRNIFRNFKDIYNERQGIKTVLLTTAIEVGSKEEESINELVKEHFHAKSVDFQKKVDKQIIGGFIIQIEDQLLDASVRRQLEKVKYELTHKQNII